VPEKIVVTQTLNKVPPVREEISEDQSNLSEEETPAPENGSNGKENQVVHTKSVSIKGLIKGGVKDIPVADDEINEDDVVRELKEEDVPIELREKDIQDAWKSYAKSIEKSHPRIFSTLNQHIPTMSENGLITIKLISNAQRENFVQYIKPRLVKYFQENLADIEYLFETNLLENETAVKKVYTDQDKLDFMMKKNPELEKFKNRFKLDFDS